MKIRNAKKLITIILALALTLFCAASLINIFSLLSYNNKQSKTEVSAWSGSGTESDPYLITSTSDMNTLAANVNKGLSGDSYYGKYFRLTKDLDYNNAEYTPVGCGELQFKGIFDGAGHTISNTKISINNVNATWSYDEGYGVGIFGNVFQGSIKNLKSKNMYVEFSGTNKCQSEFRVGGIVGLSLHSTIEYCETEGFTVYSGDSGTSGIVYIGGIAGMSGNDIKYCKGEVDSVDFSSTKSSTNLIVYCSGVTTHYWNYGLRIENCWGSACNIDGNNITKKSRDINISIPHTNHSDLPDYTYPGDDPDGDGFREGWVDYTNQQNSNVSVRIKNCHSGWNEDWYLLQYKNLSPSSTCGPTGSTWYFDSSYSIKPFLRQFMKWYKYTFKPAYQDSNGNYVELNQIISILENIPTGTASVKSATKLSTTLFGKNISYTVPEGYTFYRWRKNDEDNSDLEILYYAVLKLTDYAITYDLAGGSGVSNATEYNVQTDSFTLSNPTRTGYTFTGWSGTGLTGSNNMTVTIPKGSTGNRSYTAHWVITDYSISYNLNGGELESGKINPTRYTIDTVTFTLNNPIRLGYIFTGWSGTGLSGTSNKTVTISKGSIGNRSYTANWQKESYSIVYNLDGGSLLSGETNPTTYTVETPTFTLNNPTKDGYTFIGWGGTGVTGSNNMTVIISQGSTGNRSYTAHWQVITYTIEYDLAGGELETGKTNPTTYNITSSFTLNNPIREGYIFKGWTGSNGFSPQEIVVIERQIGNKAYTANWEIIKFNISIKVGKDGNTPEEIVNIEAEYGNKFIYSLDMSMSEWSNFKYEYATSQSVLIMGETIKYDGYFLEYYKVTNTANSEDDILDYTDEAVVTDKTINIYGSVNIELTFVKFFELTFVTGQEGVEEFETLNSYTNPINLRSESKITGSYSGYPSRELKYSVTFFNGLSQVTKEIAKYTLKQYYTVTDSDDIEELNESSDISPIIEFYACTVTITKTDLASKAKLKVNGEEIAAGVYELVVEYNTRIEFKTPTQNEGKFTYMYVIDNTITITYEILDDDYAMSSELNDKDERIWHTDLDASGKEKEYTFSETAGIECTISPTIELKQYLGETG